MGQGQRNPNQQLIGRWSTSPDFLWVEKPSSLGGLSDFAGPSTVAMDVSKEIRGTGHFSAHFPSDVDLIETPGASPTIPNAMNQLSELQDGATV